MLHFDHRDADSDRNGLRLGGGIDNLRDDVLIGWSVYHPEDIGSDAGIGTFREGDALGFQGLLDTRAHGEQSSFRSFCEWIVSTCGTTCADPGAQACQEIRRHAIGAGDQFIRGESSRSDDHRVIIRRERRLGDIGDVFQHLPQWHIGKLEAEALAADVFRNIGIGSTEIDREVDSTRITALALA